MTETQTDLPAHYHDPILCAVCGMRFATVTDSLGHEHSTFETPLKGSTVRFPTEDGSVFSGVITHEVVTSDALGVVVVGPGPGGGDVARFATIRSLIPSCECGSPFLPCSTEHQAVTA